MAKLVYLDTKGALKICYNDVKIMQELLTSRYGFQIEDLQIPTDEPGSALLPTSANIKKNFNQMIERAKGGDILLLFFSGHETF